MGFKLENSTLFLQGELDYKINKNELAKLHNLAKENITTIDISELVRIDYAMACLINAYFTKAKITGQNDKIVRIFDFVKNSSFALPLHKERNLIEKTGKNLFDLQEQFIRICNFLGQFLFSLFMFLAPSNLRLKELSNFIASAGVRAIFIVCLTSFLIGIVLAYQGASMLSGFGASIFVVDIMGIITLREIAPLIAAIVVAGRSASSFTAQIGVMKITEELPAMQTMGFEIFRFVVLPRIFALMLALPFVIFFADIVSIFGQMVVCAWYMDLSFSDYLQRFRENVELRHFWIGLVKAPIFGAVIGIIGCFRGFEVDGSTQSVGTLTTKSVVNAIFWIIALDAGFSVIFTQLNI